MRPTVTRWLAVMLVAAWSMPTEAYLKLSAGAGDRLRIVRWASVPVRYFVLNRDVPGVSANEFGAAVARAFETWASVSTSSIAFEQVGFTQAPPFDEDGITTVGFLERADMDNIIATTSLLIEVSTGILVEADIAFNTRVPWSVIEIGERGRFDVEAVAVHEIGHLLGLGHSAIGETELRTDGSRRAVATATTMFPIAFSAGDITGRTLRPDDVAGVSDLYAANDFRLKTGSVQGRVTRAGESVFGAHVVAFNLETGVLIGNFTLDDRGTFTIAGLEPGLYVLRVEPLDDVNLESFFTGRATVDVDFQVAFATRTVVVGASGTAQADIEVVGK